MNAAVQLTFFPSPQDRLQKALHTVQVHGAPHAHYLRFVRSLAVAYKSAGAGDIIVGACAGDITVNEVIIGFGKETKKFEAESDLVHVPLKIVRFNTPSCFTRRQFEEELISRYHGALDSIPFGHKGQPRFRNEQPVGDVFDQLAGLNAKTPVGRLVAQLRMKSPSLVIVNDAENLGWANASTDEVRTAWKLVIDIARQSGIPHLVFAPVTAVNSVMVANDALRTSVFIEVLQPYLHVDRRDPKSATYRQALAYFDDPLPWGTKDSLVQHIGEIDERIQGDITRLRRWVLRAVSRALCERETTHITWGHFYQTRPNDCQKRQAVDDKESAIAFRGPLLPEAKTTPPKPEPPPPSVKPGTRKAGRDRQRPIHMLAANV
jgi:hypothetical protein